MTTLKGGKYDCPNYWRLMIDACQTNCGHRFCKRCLERLFEEEERTKIPAKCPDSDCQAVLRADDGIRYFPDRCFQKEVRQQHVKCPLEKCEWVGEAERLGEHTYKHHPLFRVKPVEIPEATHVMVDIKVEVPVLF